MPTEGGRTLTLSSGNSNPGKECKNRILRLEVTAPCSRARPTLTVEVAVSKCAVSKLATDVVGIEISLWQGSKASKQDGERNGMARPWPRPPWTSQTPTTSPNARESVTDLDEVSRGHPDVDEMFQFVLHARLTEAHQAVLRQRRITIWLSSDH